MQNNYVSRNVMTDIVGLVVVLLVLCSALTIYTMALL